MLLIEYYQLKKIKLMLYLIDPVSNKSCNAISFSP